MFVCPLAFLKNHTSKFHQWPWLGPPQTAIPTRCILPVLWMTSCFHIRVPASRIRDDAYVSSRSLGGAPVRRQTTLSMVEIATGGTKGEVYCLRLHLVERWSRSLNMRRPYTTKPVVQPIQPVILSVVSYKWGVTQGDTMSLIIKYSNAHFSFSLVWTCGF